MCGIEFGWFTPPLGISETSFTPLAIWQQNEILPLVTQHFDSLWVPDHLYAFDNPDDPWLECWTTITWLAARFPSVKVGPIVLAAGFRNPALLARMGATLHALSGGRLIMAIGGGWREEEYPAYGYLFPKAATRIGQLKEAVEIMRLMWTEPAATYRGEHYHIEHAYCSPRPMPLPPIMIGGTGEQLLLPLAAQLADIWDYYHWSTIDAIDLPAYERKRDIVHHHLSVLARDPASLVQSYTIGQARLPESSGDSQHWLDILSPMVELGVTQFILDCGHVTSTEPIHRFIEEVMNPLRGA